MTVRDDALIEVQNLTGHSVGYNSFDGKHRVFEGHQIMKIRAEELRQLNYTRGGGVLLRNHLSVKNRELALELGVTSDSFDHEYNWTRKDVENLLLNGSLDTLKDALDFAPAGIIDLIVDLAVSLKISDIVKRKTIFEATGRDITSMIDKIDQVNTSTPEPVKPPRQRRVQEEEAAPQGRRVTD